MAGEAPLDCAGAEEIIGGSNVPFSQKSGSSGAPAALGVSALSRKKELILGLAILSLIVTVKASAVPRDEPTVEELKARISSANVGDKPHLCLQVAQLQLTESDKFYTAGDIEKAQAALTDVVAYSELARDYSIQSHKHQKQSEIAVRTMTRKLTEILHTLGQEDQAAVKDAVVRLNQVRDDLLASMFKKGVK